MKREHVRALVAFVIVAIVCAALLAQAIVRSDALPGPPQHREPGVSEVNARR